MAVCFADISDSSFVYRRIPAKTFKVQTALRSVRFSTQPKCWILSLGGGRGCTLVSCGTNVWHSKTPSMPVPCGNLPVDFYFFLFTIQETAFFLCNNYVRYTSQSEWWGFFFQEISVFNIALHTSPLRRPFKFWPEASSQLYSLLLIHLDLWMKKNRSFETHQKNKSHVYFT